MMFDIKAVEPILQLTELKHQYIQQATAPLDGMWLFGFVPLANHFGVYDSNKLIGYYCINTDGYLLQFHIDGTSRVRSSDIFHTILHQDTFPSGKIHGALVSTAEPLYLSLCLDAFSKFQVNALMYQSDKFAKKTHEPALPMSVATIGQLTDFVEFAKAAINAPEEWVTGYFTDLINNQELFGYWHNDQLLASGECRFRHEFQTEYADLGMIVAQSERGKGLGCQVVRFVYGIAEARGLLPICSTEKSNIGAQKALARAGMFASNRIILFDF